MKNFKIYLSIYLAFFISLSVLHPSAEAETIDRHQYIISSHPRIFINNSNKNDLKKKAETEFSVPLARLIRTVRFDRPFKMPRRLQDLRDHIYKCGYLYQLTGNEKWASLVIQMMDQIPLSLNAYGGINDLYAFALEGLSVGYDWCYDYIEKLGKKQQYLSIINEIYKGKSFENKQEFHNYTAQIDFAMFVAGLATYGDNQNAVAYLKTATDIMENGLERDDGIVFKVKDAIDYVDGSCNWEGATYGRKQSLAYVKYAEAWRTATGGKINLWKNGFSKLENAGYYRIYALQPDNQFVNVGDVNYQGLMYFDISILSGLQHAFQNPFFTTFLRENTLWQFKKNAPGIWPGRGGSGMIFYMIWYNPDLPAADLDDLPLAKKFGDIVIIRNGFKKNDTMVTFKSGIHWGFHSQLDHGSFTIYKGKPLAIDSGYYDNWSWGKRHNWNYWKRTIAHNSLLIYNPDEEKATFPKKFQQINDGGQRCAFATHRPPHLISGKHNYPKSIDDLIKRFDEFSMGKITDYFSDNSLVYINTDLTNAYNNKYSGKGNNPSVRAKSVERQFVYLKNDHIIIFDTISSTKKKFAKKWLLHSGSYYSKSGKPQLNGSLNIIEGTKDAGIAESMDSSIVKISEGNSLLLLKTLLPEKRLIRRIGGEGYEFWVNGKNWKFKQQQIPVNRQSEDPGAWRIEIEPVDDRKQVSFLNVLYPHMADKDKSINIIDKINSLSEGISGAIIAENNQNWVLLFRNNSDESIERMAYMIPSGKVTTHYIFGCRPETYFELVFSKEGEQQKLQLQETKMKTKNFSTKAGMLSFQTTN